MRQQLFGNIALILDRQAKISKKKVQMVFFLLFLGWGVGGGGEGGDEGGGEQERSK